MSYVGQHSAHSTRLRSVASVIAVALIAAPLSLLVAPAVTQAATPALSVKVSFQPNGSPTPDGFGKDIGAAYSDTAGSGWVRQDSLAATHVPFAVPLNTRDRSACTSIPAEKRRFIHMQAPATTATNDATPVAWERAVPNGQYQVSVGLGDPNTGADPESHTLNVEGVNVVRAFARSTATSCTPSRLTTGTVLVPVTDGRLTLDALGGTNTKLQYVTIDSAPDPVAGLTATPTATAVDVAWTAGEAGTDYRVFKGANLPVLTTGTPAATVTVPSFTDTGAVKGGVTYYAVQAVSASGIRSTAVTVGAMIDDAAPTLPALPFATTFREGTSSATTGYGVDSGQNFANVRGYGWVVPGTRDPLSLVGNARSRVETGLDTRLAGLLHMQADTIPAPRAGTVRQPGSWELAVADGSYDVELSVGDAEPGADPTSHEINVEGTKVVDNFIPTATGPGRFKTATADSVVVTDGRLTLDAIGGTNTKINYIVVTPTPADRAPVAPTGLTATAGDASVALDWADSTESDLQGYDVFRGTGAAVDTTGTPLNGSTPLNASTYADSGAVNGTTYRYVVLAVDDAGQRSPASGSVTATPDAALPQAPDLPLKVAFSGTPVEDRPGYTEDSGQAFTNTRGYGWVAAATGAPLNLIANGRTRAERTGNDATLLQRGLVHMQGADVKPTFAGVVTEGAWELAVPDGTYAVTVSAGDQPGASTYDSQHTLRVEGTTAINQFQGTTAAEFRTATVTVAVTDGTLTVDATGGTNTKINYLEVTSVDVTAPGAPTGATAEPGDGSVRLGWAASPAADLAGHHVYRSTGTTVGLTAGNRLTTTPLTGTAYTDGTAVNGTAYTYVVTAVDEAGNESAASTSVTATPVDTTPPAVPQSVAAIAGQEKVTVRWAAVEDADLAGYRVHPSATSPVAVGPDYVLLSPTDTDYEDLALTPGVTRHYVVTAVDAAGNASAPSVEVTATPTAVPDTTAPATPTGLTAVAGDSRITLTWTAGPESDLAGHDVFRTSTPGGPQTRLTAVPTTGTSYVDSTATNATTYSYVISAVDLAGNASPASDQVSATPRDSTPPAVPAGLSAASGVNSTTLRWSANTEPDLQRYRVYRSTTPIVALTDDNWLGSVRPTASRAWTDLDLDAGTPYYYVISAEDKLGNESAPTAVVTATPTAAADTVAPGAPVVLLPTVSGAGVALGWAGVSAPDLKGYLVHRSSTPGGARQQLTPSPITAMSFTDTTAPAGTSYYVVTAVDTSNNESVASNQVSAVTAAAGTNVKVNFQTDAAPVPAGYTKDTGAAYASTRGFGWVREDSLATATHAPLDLTRNARLRTRAGIDARLNTIVHMRYGDVLPVTSQTNGDPTPGAWEHDLPSGRYTVTVGVGDEPGAAKTGCAAPCYDSQHGVRVEGVSAINAFQATAAAEYRSGTVTVEVTDGKLTLDAIGSTNTKVNYVEITSSGPVVPDTTRPGAPTAFTVLGGDSSATLSWSSPSDPDVAGYHVYRGTDATVAPAPGTMVNVDLLETTSFTDQPLVNGTRYHYVVTTVDTAGNESVASVVGATTPAPSTGLTAKVDFQDAAATPAAGYLGDWGQPFGARTSNGQGTGSTYGWVGVGMSSPLSLVGNGRNRNVVATGQPAAGQSDQRLATFLHMQAPANAAAGTVTTPGSWEMAVPNGAYVVTVAVGDAGTAIDSVNWINVENQNALAAVIPTVSAKFATATRTVVVSDGRLTLSPAGGTNTKIAYVDVASLDTAGRPYAAEVNPANGEIGTVLNVSPTSDNVLNAETGAVDELSLPTAVTLTRVSDGVRVPGAGGTSGGGDTVSFRASAPLAAGTLYRFDITSAAKDKSGRAFLPFSSVFTTVASGGSQPPATTTAAFDKVPSGASAGKSYTSMVVGPDGRLYAGSIYGQIYRWTIGADGTLSNETVINTVRTHASARGWEGAPNRTVIGLAFDPASTAANPVLWISDNYAYLGADVPDATGAISRLSGPDLGTYQEVVVNLPRSIKDHETNSVAFKDGKLYVVQGSMNAMGASEGTWKKEEHLLSAALLELDPTKLPATLPLDVATPDLDRPARLGGARGTYDPYAANAPLTLYATGIRNAYDLVWHSNGHLYTGVNGSAAGGATPATPATLPASCAKRPDGGYTGPGVPQLRPNNQAETDYLLDVRKGKYYGHPNPMRCEYVLNAGNPVGYTGNPLLKVNGYPQGTPADTNYDLANVYDAGLHASANGAIEYKNTQAFGGAFAGKLVVVRYSANQEVVAFDVADGTTVSTAITGIAGFTGHRQPLDVAEDAATGNLYVSQLTDNPGTTGILLLKPQGGTGPAVGSAQVSSRLVFTDTSGGAASPARSVEVRNAGSGPLRVTSASITGPDAALFAVTGGALPATVAPGATLSVPVTFAPTAAGPRGAVLTLSTDDPRARTTTTTLRGLGVVGQGGSNEPSLQWILDTLQIPVDVGDTNPADNAMPDVSTPIGDEVLVQSFEKASFDRVVSVEAVSLFGPAGPTGNPNVVTVNAHATGRPAERTPLLRGPNGANQQVLPGVTQLGEYDLEVPFGFDFVWHGLSDQTAYSEDALNTWGGRMPHKVRVYPLKNADGSLEPNAYVVAPEDVASPVDYQDAVLIVRNVKPFDPSGSGKAVAAPSELVYSGVKGTTSATQQVVVTNTGATTLTIASAALTGANPGSFRLAATGPQTVAPGATATYGATFAPSGTTVGRQSAVLSLATDSSTTPTLEIGLHGLATNGEQGNNEPPLKDVVDTLGRPINVGGSGLILGIDPAPVGDEVIAPLFVKSSAGPVTMKPVARYSPDELLPFGWYSPNSGDAVTNVVASIALDQEQTLNPRIAAGGASSFDPGAGSFGFFVDSKSFGRKSFTQDGINTNIPHAVRTYPAKDRAGALIPNTYLVAFEDAQNGDYQDYVFEVSGVRPATGGSAGTPVARIDFQPTGSTVATGYTADNGAAWNAAAGRGWVRPGTATPLDMTAQTRDRAGTAEARLRTLILMQPTTAQSPNGDGAWELAVPNGTYVVSLSVGDPGFVDSSHTVRVEGQPAVSGFVPTAAVPSRSGTVTVPVTDGRLTLDAVGGSNTKLQYVDVDRVVTGADTTAPTVTAAVSGLQATAGVYRNGATVTVTAADTGSGVSSTSYSLDGGAFTPYTAPVAVSTVGSHTVRARAQDVAGNVSTSAATAFSVVAAAASRADISLENLDGVPYADRLVMNRIQNPETGATLPANVVHDVATLRVRNTGTDGLNVTGLALTGPFALVNTQALPALVPAGGTIDVPVRFTATTIGTAGGLWTGSLTVTSDDVDEASLPVQLGGFWQVQSEGGQEPDMVEIARLFGYTTTITASGVPLNQNGRVAASGDEVLSPYWLRADPAQPVGVRQLAAFHTQGNTASVRWHPKGSGALTGITTHAGVEGQSILPHRNGSTTLPASGELAPTTAFGFNIDGEWSDPTRNNQAADTANGCTTPCGHHLRVWAARDLAGAVIPNTWLMGMDYSGINYDYNDNVYLVTNMRPEVAADPVRPAPLPGAPALQLGFDGPVPGTLVDADGQGTGFGSTQPNKLDTTVGSSSYAPGLLDVSGGTLKVTTSGTPTLGTNGANDNTLVNGLQLAFDGTGGPFTVTGRTLGPVTQLNAGSEQQAVMLGSDQDNYVKLAAIAKGVPSIEFYAELGGTGTTQGATVAIPSPATVTSLDLALIGDPSAGTVKAAYRTNGATAWTVLPTTLTLPPASAGRIFDRQAKAGILVSHKAGEAFVASYDSFGVLDGDVTGAASPVREALYRLDVAGAGSYTDSAGQVWSPDTGRFAPTTAPAEGASATQEIAGTSDDVLYRTYRGNVGALTPRVLSYALPTRGVSTVDVRLHFAERAAGNDAVGRRVFDIQAEGKVLRSGFDVFAAANGLNTAVVLPVNGIKVTDGRLDLAFRASVDYPSIAAIEVLCQGACPLDTTAPAAPVGLTATPGATGVALDWADSTEADLLGYDVYRTTGAGAPAATRLTATPLTGSAFTDTTAPAATSVTYTIVATDTAENASPASAPVTVTTAAPPVQQPIRINTGGPAQAVGGTTWSACSSTTACSGWVSGGNAYAENDTVTGIPAGMSNTIFQSEWTGGGARGARAFGYDVPVQNGRYSVRLHFTELNKLANGARLFSVNLEGARVLTDFDVFRTAGGADRAIVQTFTTTVTDGKVTIDFLAAVENAKVSAIEVLPLDSTPPAVVTGVTGGGTETAATLSWAASPASDLAGYNVYRSASATGTFTKVNTALVTGPAYVDPTAPVGPSSYQVTAVDTSTNESARSATVTANRLPDTTAPAAVSGLTGSGTGAGNLLTWGASTAPDLAGYRVLRSDSPGGATTELSTALLTGTSFVDTTAPEGVTRSYTVIAQDRSGNQSARPAAVSVTRPDRTAPAVLTGVTATAVPGAVQLAWAASAAPDLAGYSVYRSASVGGTYAKLTPALVTGTGYRDATAPAGPSYYQLTATDAAGNESTRSATVSAAPVDATPPPVVTGLVATGTTAGITLAWAASPATDLAGYDVLRSDSANGTFTKLTTSLLTGTSYADATAPTGATSHYRVLAVDRSANASGPASASAVRPGSTPQAAIRVNTGGPAVTTGGVSFLADRYFTGGATYTAPGASAIAGTSDDVLYRSERSAGTNRGTFGYAVPVPNGTYDVRLHFAEIYWGAPGGGPAGTGRRVFSANLEGGPVELANLDLNAVAAPLTAVLRTFRVTVTDGRVDMAFTAAVDQPKVSAFEVLPVSVDTTAPAALTGVTATGATSGNTVRWSASPAADLAGYHVYRSATPTGTYARLTTSPVSGTSFAHPSAPAGASSYQVTAVDRSGNESARSATATTTRPAAPVTRSTVRINTGGTAQTVGGTTWSACTALTACSGWVTGGFVHAENDTITGVPAGMNAAIFTSEWTGGQSTGVPVGQRAFGFDVPVVNGAYTVRLHFAELSKGRGQRTFDVRLEGTTVLSSYDVFAAAGGIDRVVTRSFPVTITDGKVTLDFLRRIENAKVSAIEIVPA